MIPAIQGAAALLCLIGGTIFVTTEEVGSPGFVSGLIVLAIPVLFIVLKIALGKARR